VKKKDFTPEFVEKKVLQYLMNQDFPHDELSEIGAKVYIDGLSDVELNSVKESDSSFIVDGQGSLEVSTDKGEGDVDSDTYPIEFIYEFDEDGRITKRIKREIDTSSFFEGGPV
jgi:hypothetical protein